MSHSTDRWCWILAVMALVILGRPVESSASWTSSAPQQETKASRIAHLLRVRLPIDVLVGREIQQTLKRIAEKAPRTARPEDRPLVVLEFDTVSGKTGRGSVLEACQALARDMRSVELNRIETIAYIPRSDSLTIDQNPRIANSKGCLLGHAVLVAIAANQLAMEPGTLIGEANADVERIDKLVRTIYETVTEEGLTLPLPVVMSMLDPSIELHRVTESNKRADYVDREELSRLEKTQVLESVQTVSKAGTPLLISAEKLVEYGLIRLMPGSKNELASELGVNIASLDSDPTNGDAWRAVQIPLPFKVDDRAATWVIDQVNQQVGEKANLIILTIDDNDGDVDACVELAQRIAELNEREIRTVAFVSGKAQEGIGVIALACDHLIMAPDSTIGGFKQEAETQADPKLMESILPRIKNVASTKNKNWSMLLAMIDPSLVVTSYRNTTTGQIRLLCDEELKTIDDPEKWTPRDPMLMSAGLNANTAEQISVARLVAEDMDQLQTYYQLDAPPVVVELMASERWLDSFAAFLRSPLISLMLLMGGFIFISKEMSAPGLGVPGFLGVLFITLYFWSMYLGGNAAWFEILMFLVGSAFIALEIFVVPGFGVFGIGGILLVGISLVLSAQKFFIPSTIEEIEQLPYSLLPVVGAGLGVVAGAWFISNTLPNSRYFRSFMIKSYDKKDTGLGDDRDSEAMVDWSFLQDQAGKTVTRLNPAGKVKIQGKVYDVISTGQLIDKGVRVVVTEAVGNRVVVRQEDVS